MLASMGHRSSATYFVFLELFADTCPSVLPTVMSVLARLRRCVGRVGEYGALGKVLA